jgi:uncharacterized protein (DUF952 family)
LFQPARCGGIAPELRLKTRAAASFFFHAGDDVPMTRIMQDLIYKICPEALWREAEAKGRFDGAPVDHADGYIHFSTAEQAGETAAKHFAGQRGLLLVAVDAGALGDALKWEVSRGGALFPHLYAPLTLDAVAWVRPMPLGPDGRHALPLS